jgi:hypothetical protein
LVAKTITLNLYYNASGELITKTNNTTDVVSAQGVTGLSLTTSTDGIVRLDGLTGDYVGKLPDSFSTQVYKKGSPNTLDFTPLGGGQKMYMTADPRGAVPVAFGVSGPRLFGGYFTMNSLPFDASDASQAVGDSLPAVKVVLSYFM